ncbi:hypothetical protein [Falsihalocynthiibacter sp. CO-5D18]|uniref:hypothetical protein n=1 Tax=Falsihalocynthiibacter sp. CO-5D18 TaxID=3240872 RepID=UPI00350F5D3D
MEQNFGTAKIALGLTSGIGWLLAASSILVWFQTSGFQGLVATISVAVAGILIVAMSQMSFAVIATAENTREIVLLLKSEQTNSRAVAQFDHSTPKANAATSKGPTNLSGQPIKTYKGYQIIRTANGFVSTNGEEFQGLLAAEKYLRELTSSD